MQHRGEAADQHKIQRTLNEELNERLEILHDAPIPAATSFVVTP